MEPLTSVLAGTELLHGMLPEHVSAIAACGAPVVYEADEYVSRSGQLADAFWLVRQGLVAISVTVPGRGEVTIDVLRHGDFVGFSWLCPPHRLHFDVHALSRLQTVRFEGRAVRDRLDADPQLGYEVVSRFARLAVARIEAMSIQLLDLYGEHPVEQG
jgi:CRP-like cAMP-binding protein